jgi:pimeloyl-ACP methyl ester carboxylesterase
MNTVTSKDGTVIAYDRAGEGPALILVSGALGVRAHPAVGALVGVLAPHFTVISYDRRGRGDSGDTPPYAVAREVEDIDALIEAAGGSAFLYGMSSGAVLALEAANALSGRVEKLAMYEPPFIVNESRPPVPDDYVRQIEDALAAGRRGDAVEIFMTKAVGVPAGVVAGMRHAPTGENSGEGMTPPGWAAMEAVAHTLPYDGGIMRGLMSGEPLPSGRWTAAAVPVLVMTGGDSPPFFADGARALVALLPDARHRVLAGQTHGVAPSALAPALVAFFGG